MLTLTPTATDAVRQIVAQGPVDDDTGGGIAGRALLLRPPQVGIDEVRGHIHQQRPVHRIGTNQRHLVLPQQADEFRIAKTLVTDLDGVADRPAVRLLRQQRGEVERRRARAHGGDRAGAGVEVAHRLDGRDLRDRLLAGQDA